MLKDEYIVYLCMY